MSHKHRIPKVIHYAWFGRGEKSKEINYYINTWRKHLKDYKIIEWNEDNFDLDAYSYTREAYDAKKYAFVTDVVRMSVLYEYGGIYMDTDVEVLKPLEKFLTHAGFSGFENEDNIPTGIIASESGNQWVKDQLDYYKGKHFITPEGEIDMTPNVIPITKISKEKHGLVVNNKRQTLAHGFEIYPTEYFCPKSYKTGEINITDNTYTIHHFSGSWLSTSVKRKNKVKKAIRKILGVDLYNKLMDYYTKIRLG